MDNKPLALITTWNRMPETRRCLESFAPFFERLHLKIIDNGSYPEMRNWLRTYAHAYPVELVELAQNIGCPRALNVGLLTRTPGQAVIKIDNDVVLDSHSDWLEHVIQFETECTANGHPVAMLSAYYEPWEHQRVIQTAAWRNAPMYAIRPVVGHCVYHSGAFMDRVGYFDVLSPEHLYGFEDLLLSHKATALGWGMYAWAGWKVSNIQRQSAIGDRETREAHVAAMRPLYNARAQALSARRVYTDGNGELV